MLATDSRDESPTVNAISIVQKSGRSKCNVPSSELPRLILSFHETLAVTQTEKKKKNVTYFAADFSRRAGRRFPADGFTRTVRRYPAGEAQLCMSCQMCVRVFECDDTQQ